MELVFDVAAGFVDAAETLGGAGGGIEPAEEGVEGGGEVGEQ